MGILEMIEQCTYSANIDGCAKRVVDRDELLSLIEWAGDQGCKGSRCSAVNGVGHSQECIDDHNEVYRNEI